MDNEKKEIACEKASPSPDYLGPGRGELLGLTLWSKFETRASEPEPRLVPPLIEIPLSIHFRWIGRVRVTTVKSVSIRPWCTLPTTGGESDGNDDDDVEGRRATSVSGVAVRHMTWMRHCVTARRVKLEKYFLMDVFMNDGSPIEQSVQNRKLSTLPEDKNPWLRGQVAEFSADLSFDPNVSWAAECLKLVSNI